MRETLKNKKIKKDEKPIKRTIADSVFTNLFGDAEYLLQFYQAIHPEDKEITEEDFSIVTIENILADGQHNDLGALAKDKILFLCEAQSTWSINILIRVLMYLADTYARYCKMNNIDLYKSRKAELPKPELYVLFTGERKTHPKYMSLREDFFQDVGCPVEVKIRMIYDGKPGDIIYQYVAFTRFCKEQVKIHGYTRKALKDTIQICKDRGILREYLEKREEEVVTIMSTLFSEEDIIRIHDDNIRKDAWENGNQEGRKEGHQEGRIQGCIETCQHMGQSKSDAKELVIMRFQLSENDADQKIRKYWIEKHD